MLHSYHNHTYRCNHASGVEREYIEKAIESGIRTLGFSDHVPMPFAGEYYSFFRMKPAETDDYFYTLEELKREYQNDIRIRIGFEAEYYPEVFPRMIEFLNGYPCEYLILGQHALGNEENDIYCSRLTDDPKELVRYVDQVTEGLKTGKFLYFAHPDIFNFVGDGDFYKQQMSRLCTTAREQNVPLEINILGMREKRNYPNPEFWKVARDVGCKVVLGADAHTPTHVYSKKGIEKARALAAELGITVTESLEDRFGD